MGLDLTTQTDRKLLIEEIKNPENIDQKEQSKKQWDILNDFQHRYVIEYLKQQFSEKTVDEIPVISSINLAKRIVGQEASIYKMHPKRTFTDLTEDQEAIMKEIYRDAKVDTKLMKSNRYFKLQNQNLIQVLPVDGQINLRTLMRHHYDVIPNEENPEIADGYIISTFDRTEFEQSDQDSAQRLSNPTGKSFPGQGRYGQDFVNQNIADPDDAKLKRMKFTVWTKDLNFVMNGKGEVVSGDDMGNPLGRLPFIDVYEDKDFEYFIRQGQTVTDFSVQYNGAMSDLANVVRMQGWAQAFFKGPQDLIPENLQIGPNFIIKLPVDPNNPVDTEFGFANPSPDLAGSINFIEVLLANFLTARGIDPKLISGKPEVNRFSSGVERLLATIDKFEASRSDFSVFKSVEARLYSLIKDWHNLYSGTEFLRDEYSTSNLPDDSEVIVEFAKPEQIQSKKELEESLLRRMESGLMSRKMAIMELHETSEEQADEILRQIDQEDLSAGQVIEESR